jgi:ATP-dependent Clp protease ATP-binding subunit ClpA
MSHPPDILLDEEQLKAGLKARVRGQDHVIDDLARLLCLRWGREQRATPIANLLFLGRPGTGKNELCNALVEQLYGDEKKMLRFDLCSLDGPESKVRLIGVPPGYLGAARGGQLTRPMIDNPHRIVLFDQIDKAHPSIIDVLVPIMGEGRLAEQGTGKVADFTRAIIILTSNAVEDHLRHTQIFRPEVLDRLDRVHVFKPLEEIHHAEIAALWMKKLAREYGLELADIDPHILLEAMHKGSKLQVSNPRELACVIAEMLAEPMLAARQAGCTRIKVTIEDDDVWEINNAS